MERVQEVLRRLGDPTRLRVLRAILDERRNVSQIVAALRLSQPQVSYHLRMLRESGLAVEEREGRRVWYEANRESEEPHVRELLALLAGWSTPAARPGKPERPVKLHRSTRPHRSTRSDRPMKPEKPRKPGGDIDDFLL